MTGRRQPPGLRSTIRELGLRNLVDGAIDWTRYQLDSLSDPIYLPTDHLPQTLRRSIRTEGSRSRWRTLRPVLLDAGVRSALDVGCNNGWFVVELGRLGIAALGIENHPAYHRAAAYSVRRNGLANVGVSMMSVDDKTIALLPNVDCVLFLSLWHHLVNGTGLDAATAVLRGLWARANKLLVFETVTERESDEFGLPELEPDADTWLRAYLSEVCRDGHVVALGAHPVAHQRRRGALQRTMFAVVRSAERVRRIDIEGISRGYAPSLTNAVYVMRDTSDSSL
jgi:hypothetical protein